MDSSIMIHIDDDDVIVGERGNSTTSNYGTISIGDDVTIFPRSKAGCRALIAAAEDAAKHFEHARPLGVPDITMQGSGAVDARGDSQISSSACQSPDIAARDAHDEEEMNHGS